LQKVEEAHKCFADVQHKMDEKVDDIHKMLLQWNLNSEFGSSQNPPPDHCPIVIFALGS
jgi:hypothetical protein